MEQVGTVVNEALLAGEEEIERLHNLANSIASAVGAKKLPLESMAARKANELICEISVLTEWLQDTPNCSLDGDYASWLLEKSQTFHEQLAKTSTNAEWETWVNSFYAQLALYQPSAEEIGH